MSNSLRFEDQVGFDLESGTFDVLGSRFLGLLGDVKPDGVYEVRGNEGRLDLVAQDIYASDQPWWILLIYNGLTDPDQLDAGFLVSFLNKNSLASLLRGT